MEDELHVRMWSSANKITTMLQLPWLQVHDPFPPVDQAWGPGSPAPGLLAAGGALDVATLRQAYARGIFPWFSTGQPHLWWSPDPRMVLVPGEFRLRRSMTKTLRRFMGQPDCHVRMDHDFDTVIHHCSSTPRPGQNGTWIVPEMVQAYRQLHRAGVAHSVETWVDGQLVGGLYLVCLGAAVFGESMFSHRTDASKIALCALVAWCLTHGITQIDCQQNTAHLASMGAREVPRVAFMRTVAAALERPTPPWRFDPVYWNALLPSGNQGNSSL